MRALSFPGRPPILIAKSVRDIAHLRNPYAIAINDRSTTIDDEFVNAVLGQSIFSWEGRNPTPAVDENGNFQATDLDLLSFLVPLAARKAVIEIPRYRNRMKTVRKENERKIGSNNFGTMTGMTSHKDVFSFSVRLFDQTIAVRDPVTEVEKLGAHRNYSIVDGDATWYDGWDRIVFDPSAKENEFLTENKLFSGNTVYFKHYVHPNRKQSVYGAPYLLLKMLSSRLSDEASFYRTEVKRLEALGITLPAGQKGSYVPTQSEGETKPVKVNTMEMVLDMPAFAGEYSPVENTEEGIIKAYQRQKHLTYTLKPLVQFVLRADEAAFFLYGEEEGYWQAGYRVPRGRVDWNQMVLSNQMALRYRLKSVTQQVAL